MPDTPVVQISVDQSGAVTVTPNTDPHRAVEAMEKALAFMRSHLPG